MLVAAAVVVARSPTHSSASASSLSFGGYAAVLVAAGSVIIFVLAAALSATPLSPATIMGGQYFLLVAITVAAVCRTRSLQRQGYRVRRGYESLILWACMAAAGIAVLVTIGIIASVIFESLQFFTHISPVDFLFGLQWSPQVAIREEQVGASGQFGFIPLLVGTLLISCIAVGIAMPMGLLSAIYLSEFANRRTREWVKPTLEVLAGIPTIVYGFFAVVILSPLLVEMGRGIGVGIAAENALAAGLVMGVMLIPFIASLSEDAFHAVPEALRAGGLGLGSTRFETMTQIILPAALPGVVASFLLAFSRAIGETMIVVMAAGISAQLSVNPLAAVTTITVQIVALLTGDQEFDDPKTLAAFALGLALFVMTLLFNFFALRIVQKYQKRYE